MSMSCLHAQHVMCAYALPSVCPLRTARCSHVSPQDRELIFFSFSFWWNRKYFSEHEISGLTDRIILTAARSPHEPAGTTRASLAARGRMPHAEVENVQTQQSHEADPRPTLTNCSNTLSPRESLPRPKQPAQPSHVHTSRPRAGVRGAYRSR